MSAGVAEVTSWLAERHLPGKHDQSTHGHGHASFDEAAASATTGDEALKSVAFNPAGMSNAKQVENAIADYGGEGPNSYRWMNAGLRDPAGHELTSEQRANIDGLDAAMAKAHGAPTDALTHRIVFSPHEVFGGSHEDYQGTRPRDLTGVRWHDKGFVSTSNAPLEESGSAIQMRILVPKGTKAISHPDLDADEILLDRGLTFRVVADHGRATPYSDHHIDVEVEWG